MLRRAIIGKGEASMAYRMRAWGLSMAALAMAWAGPTHAIPACWSEADIDAAKVRDLQSRLMVATLRCQGAGFDLTAAYNRFVVANRTTLQGLNAVLMTQFRSRFGDGAQAEYDRYATALANAYGGDATNWSVCANAQRLADAAAAAAGSVARLVALHSRAGLPPLRPGAACDVRPAIDARPESEDRAGAQRRPPSESRPLDWLVLDQP